MTPRSTESATARRSVSRRPARGKLKDKAHGTRLLFQQLYSAARFRQWRFTMYGWTKWKNAFDFDRLKESFDEMTRRENIASINTAIANEAQELLGCNEARFFLYDAPTGMLFSQTNPDVDPIVTNINAQVGVVAHVARTHKQVRMKLDPSSNPNSAERFQFTDNISAKQIFDPQLDVDRTTGIDGTRNALAVPILRLPDESSDIMQPQLIGVCQVFNKFTGDFADDDVNMLLDFCKFVETNVFEKGSDSDLQSLLKAAEKWKLDRRIKAMNDTLYFQHLRVLMREARDLVSADRSTLFLVDNDTSSSTQMLWAKVIDGMAPIMLPFGAGVVGSAAQLASVVNIPDAYKDPRFSPKFDKKSGYRTRSILCAPVFHAQRRATDIKRGSNSVKYKSELIGIMQCINSLNGVFTDDDAEILKEYCSMISDRVLKDDVPVNDMQNIHNKINHWKRQRKKQAEIMTKYYTYLKNITSEARELVGCDRGTLFVVDERNNKLWAKVIDGMSAIQLPIGVGIAGMAAANGGTVINIPDAYSDERFNPSFDRKSGYHTRSILCVPIKSTTNKLIGILQCINKLEGIFTADDEILLNSFCHFVAENIPLNLNEDDHGEAAYGVRPENFDSVLSSVNKWKRTKKRELEDQARYLNYLKTINQEARDTVGCDRATLFLVDSSSRTVYAKVVEGVPPIKVPFGVGFAGSAAEDGGVLINVSDAYDDKRFNPSCKL